MPIVPYARKLVPAKLNDTTVVDTDSKAVNSNMYPLKVVPSARNFIPAKLNDTTVLLPHLPSLWLSAV